jgi:peptidoglycan hydrolase-like protein with peptidoglycan-binding domain
VVDGRFGPKTKKAYAQFEKSVGGDGDGIPGLFSLTKLGEGRFRVRKS